MKKQTIKKTQDTAPTQGIGALKIAVVASREYSESVNQLVSHAVKTLKGQQIEESQIRMMWAPSIFQVPLLAKSIAESRHFDGVLILGVAAKDQTDRYFFEAAEVYRALMDVMINFGIPLTVGIASAEKLSDAQKITKAKADKNPGAHAAKQLIELLTT